MLNELIEVKRRIIELIIIIIIILGFGINILANSLYQIYTNTFFWLVLSIIIIELAVFILFMKYFVYNQFDERFIFLIVFNNKQYYIPFFWLWNTVLDYISTYIQNKEIKEEITKQHIFEQTNLLLDLIEFAVIQQFSNWYKYWWLPKFNVKGYGTESGAFENRPKKIIKFEDLNEDFKEKNIAASKLGNNHISFAVPENTQLKFTRDEHSRKIIFTNKLLTIEISITISLERVGIPIDIGIHNKEKVRDIQNNFTSSLFIINFKIIPNKIKILCSSSSKEYCKWAESIFISLKNDMDYEEKIKSIDSDTFLEYLYTNL